MPASLGKRKRTSATNSTSSKLSKVPKTTPIIPELVSEPQSEEEASDSSPEDDEDEEEDDTEVLDPQEIFRRHFEAQFKPLPPTTKKPKINPIVEDPEDEDEDWDGLSDNSAEDDEQEENGVQVVEHVKKIDSRIAGMSKGELRAFMSSKIPKSHHTPSLSKIAELPAGSADDPGATEALNLKNDLALQRLLDESHLLTSSSSSSAANSHAVHTLQGKNRLKALDMRVQALGGKTSIHTQESMPMNMRKGIIRKAEEKEERRRREAKENGIVLETKGRGGGVSGGRERRKERSGTGGTFDSGPGVGRMRGATLSLSERDVVGIEGSKRGGGRMGRNGKRGGRGRGRGNRS